MIIKTVEPLASFDIHYSNPANKRVLLSGKFGSGKTYFLKEYFKLKEEDTNVFWLSPVKYSVGLNEDIFEYIKFDLAIKLIGMPEFAPSFNSRFGEDLYMYQFLSNQPLLAIDTLLILLETMANGTIDGDAIEVKGLILSKAAKEIAVNLMNYYKKYKTFKGNIDAVSVNHSDLFKNYLESSVLKRGSIFENDLITQTIKSAIEICKHQGNKENVLIIDDFDRIDPEHVFRILNILSVHNDMFDEENKFGFDKIIVVCDYDNIEKIYSYKYGNEINFSGYISKFFSTEVFHYDNRSAIRYFCRNELGDIIQNKDAQDVLGLVLGFLVEKNFITMRDIVKIAVPLADKPIVYGPYRILDNLPLAYRGKKVQYRANRQFFESLDNTFFVSTDDYPFIQAIRILCIIFGDYSAFRKVITQPDLGKDMIYEKEYLPKILRSIMLLYHHAKSRKELSNLCLTIEDSGSYDIVIGHPSTTFFGQKFMLPTGWKEENKYRGDVSYYKNVTHNLCQNQELGNTVEDYKDFKYLLWSITQILDFLDLSGTLQSLGVTKSSISNFQ